MNSLFQIGSVSINIVDIIVVVICLIMAIKSCISGFIKEFSHTAGLVFGIAAGFFFRELLASFLLSKIEYLATWPSWALSVVSFAALLLVAYLIFMLLGKALRSVLEGLNLNAIDNILGFVWGLLYTAFFISIIIYLLSLQSIVDLSEILNSSFIVTKLIQPLAPSAIELLSTPEVTNVVNEVTNSVNEGVNLVTNSGTI